LLSVNVVRSDVGEDVETPQNNGKPAAVAVAVHVRLGTRPPGVVTTELWENNAAVAAAVTAVAIDAAQHETFPFRSASSRTMLLSPSTGDANDTVVDGENSTVLDDAVLTSFPTPCMLHAGL